MESICRRALGLGLRQIAFTEHVDFVPADIGCGFFRPAAFLQEIARGRRLFQERLSILAGGEIGEFHRYRAQADALIQSHHFDLVMASLHWVSGERGDHRLGRPPAGRLGAGWSSTLAALGAADLII